MSSPDFRTFVDSLIGDHQSWLSSDASPSGNDFLDHYVGDETPPAGLLRRYEAWSSERGYTRVRQWNGTEALDRPATTDIPSPGRVFPWLSGTGARPPFGDGFLASTSTTADLQGHFASVNALGQAIHARPLARCHGVQPGWRNRRRQLCAVQHPLLGVHKVGGGRAEPLPRHPSLPDPDRLRRRRCAAVRYRVHGHGEPMASHLARPIRL